MGLSFHVFSLCQMLHSVAQIAAQALKESLSRLEEPHALLLHKSESTLCTVCVCVQLPHVGSWVGIAATPVSVAQIT